MPRIRAAHRITRTIADLNELRAVSSPTQSLVAALMIRVEAGTQLASGEFE
jgi:hypothetical protein